MDDSIQCTLGRMLQKFDDIQKDIAEIKEEQKRIASYVDTSRIGVRVFLGIIVFFGSAFVYFKEHLEALIFGKVPT